MFAWLVYLVDSCLQLLSPEVAFPTILLILLDKTNYSNMIWVSPTTCTAMFVSASENYIIHMFLSYLQLFWDATSFQSPHVLPVQMSVTFPLYTHFAHLMYLYTVMDAKDYTKVSLQN